MVEFATQYPWLIPALPLLACLLIALTGTKLKGFSAIPAILAMAISFILAITLLITISNDPTKVIRDMQLFDWFSAGGINGGGGLHVTAAITIDQLTALYLSFITGIGLLIFIYASAYMKGDYGYWRFFSYLSIFAFFMCCLVMSANFIGLYLGWEGVGLASYLLIGYYYPRPSAVAAAKKAFITNRIGDFGLAIGIFIIYKYFGTLDFSTIFTFLSKDNADYLAKYEPVLYWIPFCIMLGAFGKSAQFPLHVWLPDAMEGPTPVSALIHAATMVTAGIYLIARTMPLFTMYDHNALDVVACIGGFTAFLAASIAMCTYDLKRIWAYSTLSQLGYMFLGLGMTTAADVVPTTVTTQGADNLVTTVAYHVAGPASSAVFHVFTHAFFKALLFLSAGSVMHAMGGELDIRKMSGIRKVMPITTVVMLIGCIALAGVPGFAGFFSKDEIIAAAINSHTTFGFALGILAFIVALMTAYYTFRLFFKVFTGPLELPATAGHHEPSPFALAADHAHHDPRRDHEGRFPHAGVDTVHAKQGHEEASHGQDHAHDDHAAHTPNDGSPLMWLPLLVLSIGAIAAGYLGTHYLHDWFHNFLAGTTGTAALPAFQGEGATEHAQRVSESVLLGLGIAIPLLGIAIAFYFYKLNRHAADIVAANCKPLVAFLHNKWYIDDIYNILITKTFWVLAHLLAIIDKYVIDGLVFFVGFIPQIVGYTLKPTQRGVLQRYAVGMIAGLAVLILVVLYMLRN